jgi:hypothetical protein
MVFDLVSREVDDPSGPLRETLDRLPILPF